MKNNQDKEFKRWLKNKISVTQALMIQFLITGSLSMFGLAAMSLGSNVAYADLNQAGTGANNSVAIGQGSSATNPQGVAVGYNANAGGNNSSIAIGNSAQATGNDGSLAIGRETKASGSNGVAIGRKSKAIGGESVAIGLEANSEGLRNIAIGNNSITRNNDTIALGTNSKATGESAVAFGRATSANGNRAMAFGNEAQSTHNDSIAIGTGSKANNHNTIAFGNSSVAKKENDIVFGREAATRDQGAGHSIAIGYGAMSGSNKGVKDLNGGDAGGVAIGTGAYTGVNRGGTSINSSVAIGAGAGAGFRSLAAEMPEGNATDVDKNEDVLKKAFGVKNVEDYKTIAGGYTSVDINEATALGRNARAIGDQSIAIGAQTIAGHGAIALGGNDITQFANKKYYKSIKENFNVRETIDHDKDAVLSNDTISGAYKRLVGADLDTAYKATYAQDGSVVLGMQAHSGTPLGTALGTNALIRKGAFGATAIGAGSQIQANAEAAVAIGMGSVANGSYSLAAGTASWAEFGDVAIGYQAEARGKDGAIAIGRGTKSKGDSSVILGGANIESASKQNTSYITDKLDSSNQPIIEHKNVNETISGEKVSRRYSFVKLEDKKGTIAEAYKVLTGKDMVTAALDYSKDENKNGHASTSIGVHSLAKGDLSSAFGAGSRANSIGALALGTGAVAHSQNSVAIGTGSIAGDPDFKNASYDLSTKSTANLNIMGTRQTSVSYDKDGNVVSDADASKVAYKFSWAGGDHITPGDIVSFGSPGSERQLKHVAAGRVAEDSTDAVNGSQLNSIAKRVASGWNVGKNDKAKVAGIGSEDQVNFINGNGTTVTVEKQDEVKNGATITTSKGANVKFDVKAKDGSIISDADGITVNTDGTTITKDTDGKLKVNTGNIINNNGVPTVADADKNKIATAETVANAIKDSYWIASATKGTSLIGNDDNIKAGTKVIFDAGKNIEIEHSIANKFTFKTVDTPEFKDITLNDGSATPNKVKLAPTTDGLKLSKGDNADSPAKITNVAAGTDEKDAVNYKQLQDALNSVSSSWKIEGSANGGTYNKDASTTASEQIVSKDDKVGLKAGKNIVLDQSGKEFTYSLSKELTGLEKVEVKDDEGNTVVTTPNGTTVTDKDGNTSKLDGTGLTITPKDNADPKKNISITKDGINAGENSITNVAGNLPGAKKGTDSPKTSAEAPTATELPKMVNNAATVGDVLNAGWNLQGNGVAKDFVKPYDTVNFVDGMNTRAVVTTDADGKVSNVQIDVKDLPIAYTNADGDKVVKGPDNKFYKESDLAGKVFDPTTNKFKNANGTPLEAQPTEVAKNDIKTNLVNPNAEGNKAGDSTELGNVKSGLDTIKEADNKAAAGLVNLEEKDPQTNKPKVSDNNAATVGDLRKMGWVVSADKTTGDTTKPYNDQVKNSNEVKFVGKNGIEVTGKTDDKGVRTLTFELKTGEITPTEIVKPDGTKLIKIGDKVYNPTDIDKDGNPKQNVKPVGTIAADGKVYEDKDLTDGKPNTDAKPVAEVKVNEGAKFVTGNQVADAIEQSGFNIGKVESKSAPKDSEYDNRTEKVNPNDNVQFADGRNTNVKLVTKDRLDPLGKVVTTTTVKVDVEGLPITYTNKDGKPIVKKGDKFYLLDEKGNATDTEVKVEDIKTNLVAPNSKPNEIGAPQSLGNIASGLKAADIKTDANKSDDKKVVEDLIKTPENDSKLNTGANLDDLKTLSKAGLDFGANVGDDVHRNLGEKLSILGNDKVSKEDANNEAKFSSKNVVTTTGKDSVNIKFSQNPEFDSIKIGNRENKPVVTISSEGIDAGNTKITNVAPGEISDTSQDAINGSQLSGVLKGINAGIASSVAMANLPQVSNIGMHRHNIAASVGVHRGESAFALGLSGLNHRGSLVYKASGALNTKGHVSFGIGIGYQFDRNTRDNDTHRNDIIDLKEKYEKLALENEQNKELIKQLLEMISKDARYNK